MPYSHGRAFVAVEVVGRPLLERDPEHFAEERVGLVGTDAPDEVAVQRARVAIEQRAESLGRDERRRDDRSVTLRIHHR